MDNQMIIFSIQSYTSYLKDIFKIHGYSGYFKDRENYVFKIF